MAKKRTKPSSTAAKVTDEQLAVILRAWRLARARAFIRLIIAMEPVITERTEAFIHEIMGELAAESIEETAFAFSVSEPTVENSWRPNGMPVAGG